MRSLRLAAFALILTAFAVEGQVSDARLRDARREPSNWLTYSGTSAASATHR